MERAADAGFTQSLTLVTTTAFNATAFIDAGLNPATTYYYRVRATSASGDSANTANTAAATTDYAPDNVYPPVLFTQNRLIDVTQAPYNADKTGATDSTAAIQAAIGANIGRWGGTGNAKPMTLYFPNGTYRISNSLNWLKSANQWTCSLVLQGQSRDGVVIKLADNAAGFNNAASPKAMVVTANRDNSLTGNNAFSNYIYDMTFDTGAGNPGAVGIDFLGNNDGGIRDVTIRSGDPGHAGVCGLSMMRDWPGPAFFDNVRVDGFNYGTENQGTALATSGGGNSEIFGGSFLATTPNDATAPAILNTHASTSASFYTLGTGGGNTYAVVIQEVQNTTQTNTAFGTVIALYRGANGTGLESAGGTRLKVKTPLTTRTLARETAEAISRWVKVGADEAELAHVAVRVADLGGKLLGVYEQGTITLDDNGAGMGWYVDPNLKTDTEFSNAAGPPAGIDLLTVLMHELGHALGLEHSPTTNDIMDDTLGTGIRRNPTRRDLLTYAIPAANWGTAWDPSSHKRFFDELLLQDDNRGIR